ncbi:MAG TPA: hypothetical protein VHL80_19330 [Polyangia bacterium]|nr:hypothetical protein [Polyangia bacterium]
MRRQSSLFLTAVALGALALAAPRAAAQPFAGGGGGMPNLRAIAGQPLPDRGMPAGTVSVRVARKIPANAVAGVEVAAIIKNAGGDARKRTAKTDASGRVLFEGLAPGDEFHAEVTVDGELLQTQTFAVPSEGGVRTMLIAALPPASADDGAGAGEAPAAGGGQQPFALGSTTGSAKPDKSLPTKTLEVRLLDESGRPIPNHPVTLGSVDTTNKVDVRHATTDAAGLARFTDLPVGKTTGYAAVTDWHGLHIGTEPFAMAEDGGMRAEIHALERTADPSVITIGEGARIILQMREDSLQFLEIIPLENKSDKLFDPGPGAVEIPLPREFTGAEPGQSDRKIEIRKGLGVAIHGPISPKSALGGVDAKGAGNEVSFGFVMPYSGTTREFVQPVPMGMGLPTLITEQLPGLELTGPGIGARESREVNGRKYWVMPGTAVPPGGELRFTVTGLPSLDHTGRNVSLALALALLGAGIVFSRRPRGEARRAALSERDRLTARREALFAELVAVERQARAGAVGATPERRRDLVGKLEAVYQQLAALDEQRGP